MFNTVVLTFTLFFTCVIGHNESSAPTELLIRGFEVIFYFLVLAGVAMLISYIEELHEALTTRSLENIKLLDGMHEGLLIVSKDPSGISDASDIQVKFWNGPVKKIISAILSQSNKGVIVNKKKTTPILEMKADFLNLKMFEPVKIKTKGSDRM